MSTIQFSDTAAYTRSTLTFAGSTEVTLLNQTGRYIAFPSTCRIGNRLFVAYKNGTLHVNDDATAYLNLIYSDDEGTTWSSEIVIASPADKRSTNANWQNIWISAIGTRLIAFFSDYVGEADMYSYVSYSDDLGLTWSTRVQIISTYASTFICPHSHILELEDNTHVVACWGMNAAATPTRITIQRSTDLGVTWTDYSYVDTFMSCSEFAIVRNKVGDIIIRGSLLKKIYKSVNELSTMIPVTSMTTYTFADPVFLKKNEDIYCCGRQVLLTGGSYSLNLHKSSDGGLTWVNQEIIDAYVGLASGGYADFIELTNGKTMIVYYTTKSTGTTHLAYKVSN